LAILIWPLHVNLLSTAGIALIPLTGVIVYRRWEALVPLLGLITLIGVQVGALAHWQMILLSGEVLIGAATLLLLWDQKVWAYPVFGFGALGAVAGIGKCVAQDGTLALALWSLALVTIPPCFVLRRNHRLPNLPVGLGIAGLLVQLIVNLPPTFAELQDLIVIWGLGLSFSGLILRLSVLALIRHRSRVLILWLRPLLTASTFLSGIGAGFAMMLPLYGVSRGLVILDFLLIALTTGLLFSKTWQLRWLLATLVMGWLIWVQFLILLDLNMLMWRLMPFALLLLFLGPSLDRFQYGAGEIGGIALLLSGPVLRVLDAGVLSMATGILIIEVVGLTLYGYWVRRRIPFFCGAISIVGGICGVLIWLNLWLFVLVVGVLLIVQALILEVRREWVERQMIAWRQRLQE
jgi:hypothetical protein